MSADARRAQLLEVARECFADGGYVHTTTAMIAAKASVTEPVLYRHFGSKLELFHAILQAMLEESRRHFEDVAACRGTGAERLLAMVEEFPRFSADHRSAIRVIDRVLASATDEKSRHYLGDYYSELEGMVEQVIRGGQEDGSIDPQVDAQALAWMLLMTGVGFSLVSNLEIPAIARPRFPTEMVRLVRSMIRESARQDRPRG